MLSELSVRDLGVIGELQLNLSPGLVALTGETGAGKSLVVRAIALLGGARGDPALVRAGASEAVVAGRFVSSLDDRDRGEPAREPGGSRPEVDAGAGVAVPEEVVLSRVLPRKGRSRAYLDHELASLAHLERLGSRLVDCHVQHGHQSLLHPRGQRAALDRYADADLAPLSTAQRALSALDAELAALGGDEVQHAREIELLSYQLAEIAAAKLGDDDEDARLAVEEDQLAEAAALVDTSRRSYELLSGSVADGLGRVLGEIGRFAALRTHRQRLESSVAELVDLAGELRRIAEQVEPDEERLAQLRTRRVQLRELYRKFGPEPGDVRAFEQRQRALLTELEAGAGRRAMLVSRRVELVEAVEHAERALRTVRRQAAPKLAAATTELLNELGMLGARFSCVLGDGPTGVPVRFELGANPGEPSLPLAQVASGGELARTMLALHLVATAGPPTLVFDEVDAGVGGTAALAIGRALRSLASEHQVVVVTHLAQVAAFAEQQIVLTKAERDGRTLVQGFAVQDEARRAELARMLSGHSASERAHRHAAELLELAGSPTGTGGSGTLWPERKGRRR
jgi:DNA repair protein RecN (Recombination protein N)